MKKYNIYLRKDGRWEGRVIKQSEDENRKYKYFFGITREIVVQKIDEYMSEWNNSGEHIAFDVVVKEWFSIIKCNIKESTAANYNMKANKHILPYFGEKSISEIEENDIYTFIEKKKEEQLSDRYIADIISLLRLICKYASKKYKIINPVSDVRMVNKKKSEIRVLDKTEHQKLENYLLQNRSRTNMGIVLAMATGIRIGEVCALRNEDIDWEKRILTVRFTVQRIQCRNSGKKTKIVITAPKTQSSRREIPIPESIMKYLLEYRGKSKEYLLSGNEKPLEPRTLQNRFARILNNVELPSVHFHSLRHYFASECIRLGFDIKSLSEILGHGNVEITLNRYVHSSMEQKRDYMERIKLTA